MAFTILPGGRSRAGNTGGKTTSGGVACSVATEFCTCFRCLFTNELAYSRTVDLSCLNWPFSRGISKSEIRL